jgi:hypothetical protein
MTQLQQERVRQYKAAYLNKSSKWYAIDLAEFISNVRTETAEKSMRMIGVRNYLNSDKCAQMIEREEAKMERAGMYNINNLTPLNALD